MDDASFPFASDLPTVDTPQMIEVDRAMIEDYRIELIQMMENAGRNLAHLARVRFLDGDPRDKRIVVLAGSGGNGGGALVAARRLACWGADVVVVLAQPANRMTPVPGHQLDIVTKMKVTILDPSQLDERHADPAVILDGIIGYSLSGNPTGRAATLIDWANHDEAPILCLDVPSGFDAKRGIVLDPAIRASATMTLALPKPGLQSQEHEAIVGELYVADISVPPALYGGQSLGLSVGPVFAKSDIVRLR